MNSFSQKSLDALGDFYVYGLIDPRNRQVFYIGKGTKNRVFEHEKEKLSDSNNEKLKIKRIQEIKDSGFEVEKVILNFNLSEDQAFAAEASLINAFNYIGDTKLTNIVSGHHSQAALTVESFEKIYGAIPLHENDIKHKIMIIKVNRLYDKSMDAQSLYQVVRGIWRASINKAKAVDYVFGVYNALIIAVYKPSRWLRCKNAADRLPRQNITLDSKLENRIFFEDDDFENGLPLDNNQQYYLYKSIAQLKINQSAQNPISYLYPSK